jgi:hypothetical protein
MAAGLVVESVSGVGLEWIIGTAGPFREIFLKNRERYPIL